MNSIWKHQLTLGHNTLELPAGTNVMSAQTDRPQLCIWVLGDQKNPPQVRKFEVYATGAPVPNPESLLYIGTCPVEGGRYVWHVFERQSDVSPS